MAQPARPCTMGTPAVSAFLRLLRWVGNHPNDDASNYTASFGGSHFTDTSRHPNVVHTRWGKSSTAAGAYMFVFGTWDEARKRGIVLDFSPASQDQLAWWRIGARHARDAVCGGKSSLSTAYTLLKLEWASLPGASQNSVSEPETTAKYGEFLAQAEGSKQ